MAKFIEVNIQRKTIRSEFSNLLGYDVKRTQLVNEIEYVNTDFIETILPMGDSCLINLSSGRQIIANKPAIVVLAQINGQ